MTTKKKPDPIPETFNHYEEAAEFWDTHVMRRYPWKQNLQQLSKPRPRAVIGLFAPKFRAPMDKTIEETKNSLRQAIELILEDRLSDILRGLPKDAIQEKVLIGWSCYLKREGSSHSLWINPKTGVIEAVPRHTEIKEPLAKKILKNMNAEWMPNRWHALITA
jgi:mRNA interferase HicA